jgi:hypothetical protein
MVVLHIIPILAMLALYTASLKLAARILRYRDIRWWQCLVFSLMVGAVALAGRTASAYSGVLVPALVSFPVGLVVHLALGGWYFRSRGTTAAGTAPGWRGGTLLLAVTVGLLAAFGALLLGVSRALHPSP